MKYSSLLLLLFSVFLFSGCATSQKNVFKPATTVEALCKSSCEIMGVCASRSGTPFSEHDLVTCSLQCKATPTTLRTAVLECSAEVLAQSCNQAAMQLCVKRKLAALR